jgi:hypothetical protein
MLHLYRPATMSYQAVRRAPSQLLAPSWEPAAGSRGVARAFGAGTTRHLEVGLISGQSTVERYKRVLGPVRCHPDRGRGSRRQSRLLDDSSRTGVWPDSVQVLGGKLSMRLPTRSRVWLTFGLQPVGHRDEAWLKKGLPSS